jgi:hypothetical protein
MKKIFTLAAMAMMALAANAQMESAFVAEDFTTAEGTAFTAGTTVASSASVTWTLAGDDTFKDVAMAGEADPANAVTIGNAIFDMVTGIQGSKNGKDLGTDGKAHPGIQGSEQKFTVTADGMMYIFFKGSYNKGYYVYEGDLSSNTGFPVAYTMVSNPVDNSGVFSFTLPEDGQGFGWADMTNTEYWASVGKVNAPSAMPSSTWTAGGALSVFVFPAYKDAADYYVWAAGSKIVVNGYAFDKGATEAQTVAFSKVTAVANVKAAAEAAEAPAKVIKNGQVVIADKFNAAGAQVK